MLAWEPREFREAYAAAREEFEGPTGLGPHTRSELLAELDRTREQGFAVSDEDVTAGIASLGAPVFDYTGGIRAALSVGGMKQLVLGEDRERILELLVTGAHEVSAALGHTS